MKSLRSEHGLHPFFGVLKKRFKKFERLAYQFDKQVHITPNKMTPIHGVLKKLKIVTFDKNPKVIWLTLYDRKVMQKFTFIFSSKKISELFYKSCILTFKEELVT